MNIEVDAWPGGNSLLRSRGFWLILLAHIVYWLTAFPNPDEAYYWLWGQHLDWSYYDHPPFHAWVQGLFSTLGQSPFILRLPTVVSNGLFFGVYYLISRYLYGVRAGSAWVLIVLCCWSSPLYFLFLTLAWQDQWLIAFAVLSAYCFIRFLDSVWLQETRADGYLYGGAAALGLAGLCKYTAVFVGLALLGVMVSQPRLRPLFKTQCLYRAAAIAAFFTLPVIVWNFQNDWLSFQYYVTRSVDSGSDATLRPDAVIFFWLTAILILSPPLVWVFERALRQAQKYPLKSPTYLLFTWALLLISTGLLSLVGLFSTALYYWNILAYLLLFPLVPLFFLDPVTNHLQRLGWLRGIQTLGTIVAWLLVVNYSLFPIAALFGPEGDPDGRMSFGWSQVAAVVSNYAPQYDTLLTTDYRSAAALAYRLNNNSVLAVSNRIDQFDVWASSRVVVGQSALVLADDWHPFTNLGPLQLEPEWQQLATIPVQRFGFKIKDYYLYGGVVSKSA